MRTAAGIILFVVGVILTVYVAGYLCFYMGIVDIVEGFNAEPDADAGRVAWGVVKAFLLPELVAGLTFWGFTLVAAFIGFSDSKPRRRRRY